MRSSRWRPAVVVVFCAALAGTPALAEGNPDAGRAIVGEHCVGCHDVPGVEAPRGRTDVGAPSFKKIAEMPEVYTPERLRAFLRQPHWPMTQFLLSDKDIDNLIVFIAGLGHHE